MTGDEAIWQDSDGDIELWGMDTRCPCGVDDCPCAGGINCPCAGPDAPGGAS